jgi:hypothetical protein
MRMVWCKNLDDVVNIARSHGWLFHYSKGGKHYYYIYAGVESELMCLAVRVEEPLKTKYVSIDDEGKLKTSDQPIMPSCAKVVDILRDETFEGFLSKGG